MLTTFETTDFDQLSAAQEGWEILHRPLRPDRFEGQLLLGCIGDIQVDLERWTAALELTGTSPREKLGFVLPLNDNSAYRSAGREITPNRLDLFGPGSGIDALIRPQTSLISCTLPIAALEERLDSDTAMLLAAQAEEHRVTLSSRQATNGLRRWWLKLLEIAVKDIQSVPMLDSLLDETLLRIARTLRVGQEECEPRSPRQYRLARRARDFMLDRQSNPPSVAAICAFLNTSERTLHYAFGRTYGVSLKQFLKARRLFATHRILKSTSAEARVCDIAARLGFWDLGYFARDYKAMFGELPSTTLRRQRLS